MHIPFATLLHVLTFLLADRGFAVREQLPLPSKPPYTAHLGNLSFDATEGDVNDFFADCEVTNVRIVEDKLDRKPKGFGYVEFGSVEGLKKALDLSGTQFQGRNVRVSVAEPRKTAIHNVICTHSHCYSQVRSP
jgi:translation initiation factor 4B